MASAEWATCKKSTIGWSSVLIREPANRCSKPSLDAITKSPSPDLRVTPSLVARARTSGWSLHRFHGSLGEKRVTGIGYRHQRDVGKGRDEARGDHTIDRCLEVDVQDHAATGIQAGSAEAEELDVVQVGGAGQRRDVDVGRDQIVSLLRRLEEMPGVAVANVDRLVLVDPVGVVVEERQRRDHRR
jgi:hypothetical protein